MTHNHIAWLLFKHQRNELTPDEQLQLEGWLNEAPANREHFNNCYTNAQWVRSELSACRKIDVAAARRKVARKIRIHRLKKIASYTGGALIIIAACIYFWPWPVHKAETPTIVQKQRASQQELKRDSGKVFLTLDDDPAIEVQNANDGLVAQKGNLQVYKEGKRIRCTGSLSNESTPIALQLETAWACQCELVLPDGSHIWLNAVSSVRYPAPNSTFARSVQLTGEGYFDITHDASRLFGVTPGNNTDVVVTGTKFNINAYPEEGRIKASLIEGQIKVNRGNEHKILKPGESAIVQPSQPIQVFEDSTIDQSMAWTQEEYFMFNRENKSSIIKQLERWYHVKINYRNESDELYNGTIPRNQSVDYVLHMIFDDEIQQIIHKDREITLIPRTNAPKNNNK